MQKTTSTIRDHNLNAIYNLDGEHVTFDGINHNFFIAKHPLAKCWGVYEQLTGLYVPATPKNNTKKECIKATHEVLKQVPQEKLKELIQRGLDHLKLITQ